MEVKLKQSKGIKIRDVILVLIITFALNIVWSGIVGVVYGIILMIKGVNVADPKMIMEVLSQNISVLFFSSIYNVFAIGVVFLFWNFADKRNREELGFNITDRTGVQVSLGILSAIGAVLLIALLGRVFGIISFQGFGTEIYKGAQIVSSLLLGILTFLMVGIGEEAVYRTYVQKHIVEMVGNKLGLVISAFIFMAVHLLTYGKLLDLLDVFLAGIILGYAYILTRSIYLPAAFHFMWDFLQVNIVRLQDYEYYKGPTLILFNNAGDLMLGNFNLGNKLEVVFVIVELLILVLMYFFREKLSKLAKS